ncbi:MAG: hypothetical protein WC073_08425 [Sterolibacterium sp.]
MSDRLLEQAGSLMRRRSFVAGAQPTEPTAARETAHDSSLDEVPVLTDVVGVADSLESSRNTTTGAVPETTLAGQIEAAVRDRLGQLLMERQAELAQEIETWLDEQMPQLVIRAMDGITDHLVALLSNRARDELLPRLESAMRRPNEEAAGADNSD